MGMWSRKALFLTLISPFPLLSVEGIGCATTEQNGQGKVSAEDPLFELPMSSNPHGKFFQDSLFANSSFGEFPQYSFFWLTQPLFLRDFSHSISLQRCFNMLNCAVSKGWCVQGVWNGATRAVQAHQLYSLGPCLWFLRIILCGWGISIGQERGHPEKFPSSPISKINL